MGNQGHGRRIIELDGLRGVACLAVLVAHYFGEVDHGNRFLTLGWSGVDIFFCLSGFLIGGILLDNRDSSRFFSTFYFRRSFRIFPLYYAVILIVLTLLAIQPYRIWVVPSVLSPASYLIYSQNILFAWIGVDNVSKWLLPTWTLCVEEQFYLLLPIILYWTPPRYVFRMLLAMIVSAIVFKLFLIFYQVRKEALYLLLPARWDLLFLGVMGACLVRCPYWSTLSAQRFRFIKIAILSSAAMMFGLALIEHFDLNLPVFDLFGNLAVGIACVGFILLLVGGSEEARRFRSRPIVFFGKISYGLYLVHQPIAGTLHGLILNESPDVATLAQLAV
jgi:peptidoglycan/LPS O-acetylase OafA/YrhL